MTASSELNICSFQVRSSCFLLHAFDSGADDTACFLSWQIVLECGDLDETRAADSINVTQDTAIAQRDGRE
jgi:hypothetical protein